VTELIY